MAYTIEPNLEYFLGIGLPSFESDRLFALRQNLEHRGLLSSPPHITVIPPFIYHFPRPLDEQLTKWSRLQAPFSLRFSQLGSFQHHDYYTLFLTPTRTEPLKILAQNLTNSIRFLPTEKTYLPHLTLANKIAPSRLEEVKHHLRSLKLSLDLPIDNLTLFRHLRFEPWDVAKVYYFPGGPTHEP